MIKSNLILFCLIILTNYLFAQQDNVFLKREYWKEKPTLEKVKEDFSKGNSLSDLDEHDFDAAGWAILENTQNEIIKFIIQQDGNDVNKLTHDGRTYIFWAAYKNNLELMNYLINQGARTDLIDSHGYSLVNFCAVTGQLNTEIYDLCIEKGSVITKEFNKDGASPLLLLISFMETKDQITYFTEKGLSLKSLDNLGNNAFVYAAKSGNMTMMKLLLEMGMDPHVNNDAALFFAAKGMRKKPNKLPVFKYLETLGLNLGSLNKENQNLLHLLSASNKDTVLLKYLMDKGVSMDYTDSKGSAPISIAVERNNIEALSLYFKNKGDFSVISEGGNSLAHKAVKHQDWKLMEIIIKNDIDINLKNDDGMTVLHLAAMTGESIMFLKKILDAGADKNITTEFGENAYNLVMENELLNQKIDELKFLIP